ncbi:MAG: hybrid sensor histidine kinase/response regulator [Chitinophagaceae bacterium]|nr:MAG: hybrid sensor histidine kinase/response regulator [Chitinophagaceae bacterium]
MDTINPDRMLRHFFFLLITFSPPVVLQASPNPGEPYSIQLFDNRNGLSNSSINDLFIDGSNMLWVGTWDGLNLYNGSSFHVFNYSRESDERSIGSNVIQKLAEDRLGNIWITTIEGVSRYEKKSGRFFHYFYNPNGQSRVSENEYALTVDTTGTVYCFSRRTGLVCFNPSSNRFLPCNQPAVAGKKISSLFFDAASRLWVLDDMGNLQILAGRDLQPIPGLPAIRNVSQVFRTAAAGFYTTRDQSLFRIRNGSAESVQVLSLPAPLAAIGEYQGHYLLAWSGRGCGIYTSDFRTDNFLADQSGQLGNIHITSFSSSSENILWCGTDGSGIIRIHPRTKPFGTIATAENGMPYNRSVRAFCQVGDALWVGTKGSGILVYPDFATRRDGNTRDIVSAPALIDNNSVYALVKTADHLVYIGTDGKGLSVYDEISNRYYKWNEIIATAGRPEFGSVYSIRPDPDGSVWIGTSGYGLVHLRIERQPAGLVLAAIDKYVFRDDNRGPANDIIYAIEDAGNNQLWIGCRYAGLNLMDKKTGLFKTFKAFAYEGSLSNNDVLSLHRDKNNRLWIGTSYGLNWLEASEAGKPYPQFGKLTTGQGLPNNTIHAIEEDSAGQIWISSNKGLACINSQAKISFYQAADGLQSNEFSDGAVYSDASGWLYFGGIYGFNQFKPASITRSSWLPNLLVSGMQAGDQAADGYHVLGNNDTRELAYEVKRHANYFQLDLRALSYLNAEKCEYAYFLEGYDKQWRYTGTNGQVSYSNLQPGNYTFHVKWTNGEGSWSGEHTLFNIGVLQYFWLRWYALLVYGLIIVAGLVFIYRYRKNRQAIRHQLEVEHLLREKDEAAHRSRIGFFTNIAHELQTPLTLIMGSAERFRENDQKGTGGRENNYFLSLIHQQASRLTYMVHQLLDFRKSEEGFATNKYVYLDISALLQNLAEPFLPLGERSKTEYEIQVEGGITGWTDKDKLEKIVYNLLSNAFKHAANNEQIVFNAVMNREGQLQVTVTNPCNPIPPEELEHLFDEFYTSRERSSDTPAKGTGIGLAFTRQLVQLLQGRIGCEYLNQRISFRVELPLRQPGIAPVPLQPSVMANQPSSLYSSITAAPDPVLMRAPAEINKHNLVESIGEDQRKTILVVEDDNDIRFLLRDILQDEYLIHEATDGLEAISLIEKIIPSLVICDVMMPNMNGLELCNRVKNSPATCHVPFMILSARGSEDHHMEGYEVGADAYIAKPFQTGHLLRRVRKLIQYRQQLVDRFAQSTHGDPIAETEMPAEDKLFLTRLAAVIGEHISEPELSAVFLEKEFSLSKMQLYRRLKTMTGMTPGEFIKHIRLKEAANLLRNTGLSVNEIFYQTGFNNQSYFFREFKKKYQQAPGEYRDSKTATGL